MPALPSGDVTFLFTDIEASTRRWETDEAAMWADIRLHNEVLRRVIQENGGYPFKTIGDAFQAAFGNPADALAAVVAAQRLLAGQAWSTGSAVRVRMALHTGEAQPNDGDYLAPCLNRLARLLSTGFGGQVLVSSITAALVRDDLPQGVSLRDLGSHRLRDLNQPERIFQVVAPGLPDDFPALKSLDSRPHNLPIQPTSLIGREDDVAIVREMMSRPDTRLVTLTGPGGTGKTRLSLQVAADSFDEFSDGVFFVPLASVSDPRMVGSTIAVALRIQETGDVPVDQLLRDALRDKQMLLVLDNFEHIVDGAGVVGDLLGSCRRVKALATSRIRLGLYGELEYPVPPLELPDPDELPLLDQLVENQAVRLFADRARALKPDFAVTERNAAAVAEICCRLDGLPLAIELLAARVKLLTPQAMLQRMEQRLPLLTGGARNLPERHQTLRNTIAWSHDLLSRDEQRLYRRLSVFAGGWTLESAETVVDVADFDDPLLGVLDSLAALVDHNLVRQEEQPDGMPRFSMLQTIREFGQEQLRDAGETADAMLRMSGYYVELVEQFEPVLFGPEQVAWLDRLETEFDNLRAVVQWSLGDGPPRAAIQIAGAMRRFWEIRGYLTEASRWLEAGIGAAPQPTAALARALDAAGDVLALMGDNERARQRYEESLALANSLGLAAEAALTTHNLGTIAMNEGDLAQAVALYEQSLTYYRGANNRQWIANLLNSLAVAHGIGGDLDRAEALLDESLALQRALKNPYGITLTLANQAEVASQRGDIARATRIVQECLTHYQSLGSVRKVVDCIGHLADLAALHGDAPRAATLYGIEEAQWDRLHAPPSAINMEAREQSMAIVRARLPDAQFSEWVAAGRAMSFDEAVALALEPPGSAASPPASPADSAVAGS